MHVAIVEDEKELADSICDGLMLEGYVVKVFYDGKNAYEDLEKNYASYDLIILDLILPEKSGFEIARSLRGQNIITPILVLTARDSVEDKVYALDSGADDLLTKPFSFEELLARMRALLRRPQNLVNTVLKIYDLILDPASHEVRRSGNIVSLTLKEFELLFFLIRNRGQVKTRSEILEHLWGVSEIELGNVVDVHIRNLRSKIDDNHDQKIIQTIRGVGYVVGK